MAYGGCSAQVELDDLLAQVERPARYVGGELHSVVKTGPVRARLALCFPDLYEIAESYLGFKILYDLVNARHDFAAERAYAVAPDLEALLRARRWPLGSLETRRPLSRFDVLGFTLQYELSYPTILAMLELGRVTLRTASRGLREPLVIGGGIGAFHPEPLAPFFDAFLLGDGEDAVLEILDVAARARARGAARGEILDDLATVAGVYVPSQFQIAYEGLQPIALQYVGPPLPQHGGDEVQRVRRRVVVDLDRAPYPARQVQPSVQPVHDRIAVEIQRGCSRGCRFCQAGMVQRPTRQRSPERVLGLVEEALRVCGGDTVGLLSLSAGDYGPINELVCELLARLGPARISVSLPSLRTETLTPDLAARLTAVAKTSFTLAPEAGSERLRRVINKTNTEADLLRAIEAAARAGARLVKLYFMVGLPTETEADLDDLVTLAERARCAGRAVRKDFRLTVSVSTLVPKPHTPFQWERQASVAETVVKQNYLRERLRPSRITLHYHDAEQSFVEGVLARGDRRLADALENAMRAGCRLDGWSEHFDPLRWRSVLETSLAPHGLSAADYLRERDEGCLLPWDHLDAGLHKKFLRHERRLAYQEATREDCALTDRCFACGGCDLADGRALVPRERTGSCELRPIVRVRRPLDLSAACGREKVGPAPATTGVLGSAAGRLRLRLHYSKLASAVHFSQLDVARHLFRALRLARVPVAYSQGHTPRPRVSFSPACPTGVASMAEYADIICTGELDADALAGALTAHLPAGIEVRDVTVVEARSPSLTAQITAMTYSARIAFPSEPSVEVARFLARETLWVRVRRKEVVRTLDARAHVLALAVQGERVEVTLACGAAGGLKVSEALTAVFGRGRMSMACVCKERVAFVRPERSARGTGTALARVATSVSAPTDVLDLTGASMSVVDDDARREMEVPYVE